MKDFEQPQGEIRITREYADLNRQLHESRPDYGAMGSRHADSVRNVAKVHSCKSLLDYGCGKQTLLEALRLPWARGYDPCIPGLDLEPQPAELVVCTDTLEHIEPDCLEAVLDHIRFLCQKVLYVSISLIAAKKQLPDGRNTHLIVQPSAWWMWRLLPRWDLDTVRATDTELTGVFRATGHTAKPMKILNNVRE